jgi:DNA-binding NarL/FixJ family response regulator
MSERFGDLSGRDIRSSAVEEAASPPDRTIILIDSHLLRRDCLAALFSGRPVGTSVAVASSVAEAAERGFEDVGLVVFSADEGADHDGTMEAVEQIAAFAPEVPVVLISSVDHLDAPSRLRLFQMGVRAVLSARSTAAHTALAALNLVAAGGSYFPENLTTQPEAEASSREMLTSRQSEVLRELRQGKPNKIIAYELGMSESTVKVHVRNLMRKLGATNRTQVVFKAADLVGSGERIRGAA